MDDTQDRSTDADRPCARRMAGGRAIGGLAATGRFVHALALGALITVVVGKVTIESGIICPCHESRMWLVVPLFPAIPGYLVTDSLLGGLLSGTLIYGVLIHALTAPAPRPRDPAARR